MKRMVPDKSPSPLLVRQVLPRIFASLMQTDDLPYNSHNGKNKTIRTIRPKKRKGKASIRQ